ncbi:hypothetical protein [Phyllobacterium sp. P5_D12]
MAGVAFATGFAAGSATTDFVGTAAAFARAVLGFAGTFTGVSVAALTVTAFAFAAGLALAGIAFAATSASAPAFARAGTFAAPAVFGLAEAFTELSVVGFLTLPVCFFKAGAAVFTTLSTGAFAAAFLVAFAGVVSFATLTSQLISLKPARSSPNPHACYLTTLSIARGRLLASIYLDVNVK